MARRPRYALALLAIAGNCLAAEPASAVTFERITIPADAARPGVPALSAFLARPASTTPTPAIVALHGCSGLVGPQGVLLPIYRDWAERLVAAGYAVVFPDSFASRGLGAQCTVKNRTIVPRDRAGDAAAAAVWLQSQMQIDAKRLALMGWSHGGSSTLSTVRSSPAVAGADFRAAIAFYPGCSGFARTPAWRPRLPLTILMGADDDWTPAAPCRELGQRERVRYIQYPGAYHAFDHPNLPVRLRTGLTYSVKGDGIAHVGTNAAARAAAILEVEKILAAALK